MSSGGIPELGITAERGAELGLINKRLISRSKNLWDYLLELEKTPGITEREKLAMIAGTAHIVAQSSPITRSLMLKHTIINGLS